MAASDPTLALNTFSPIGQTLLGQLANAINSTKVVSGTVGGSVSIAPGSRVKLDSTVTTPGVVRFVPAADNEAAFGVAIYTVQEGTFAVGDNIEVAYSGGACIVEVGNSTLTPGTLVGLAAGFLTTQSGSNVQMGILLDYVTQSSAGRVLIGWTAC